MWLGLAILFSANLIGGAFTPLFIKFGLREIPPLTFTLLRFSIASIIFLPLFLRNSRGLLKRDIKQIFIYSILFAMNVALYSIGLQFTTVIVSQILYSLVPLIVGILSYLVLKEKFTKFKVIGSVVAFTGVIILVLESAKKTQIDSLGSPVGNIIVFAAVICWSSYFIFSQKLTKKYQPVTTSFISFATTVILLLPFVIFELFIRPVAWTSLSNVTVGSIVGSGVISSALMFFLIQVGIKKTSAYTASLFSYFAPLFSSMTAIPLLGEKVTAHLFFGGILIILGVFIATTLEHILRTGKILK